MELAPSLARGLDRLESRFGPQPQIEAARPAMAALLAKWGASRR